MSGFTYNRNDILADDGVRRKNLIISKDGSTVAAYQNLSASGTQPVYPIYIMDVSAGTGTIAYRTLPLGMISTNSGNVTFSGGTTYVGIPGNGDFGPDAVDLNEDGNVVAISGFRFISTIEYTGTGPADYQKWAVRNKIIWNGGGFYPTTAFDRPGDIRVDLSPAARTGRIYNIIYQRNSIDTVELWGMDFDLDGGIGAITRDPVPVISSIAVTQTVGFLENYFLCKISQNFDYAVANIPTGVANVYADIGIYKKYPLVNGQFFVQTATGDIYEYISAGTNNGWSSSLGNVSTPGGPYGTHGKLTVASGDPNGVLTGTVTGELYIDSSSKNIYEWNTGTTWDQLFISAPTNPATTLAANAGVNKKFNTVGNMGKIRGYPKIGSDAFSGDFTPTTEWRVFGDIITYYDVDIAGGGTGAGTVYNTMGHSGDVVEDSDGVTHFMFSICNRTSSPPTGENGYVYGTIQTDGTTAWEIVNIDQFSPNQTVFTASQLRSRLYVENDGGIKKVRVVYNVGSIVVGDIRQPTNYLYFEKIGNNSWTSVGDFSLDTSLEFSGYNSVCDENLSYFVAPTRDDSPLPVKVGFSIIPKTTPTAVADNFGTFDDLTYDIWLNVIQGVGGRISSGSLVNRPNFGNIGQFYLITTGSGGDLYEYNGRSSGSQSWTLVGTFDNSADVALTGDKGKISSGANLAARPASGTQSGEFYVARDTGDTYEWDGSAWTSSLGDIFTADTGPLGDNGLYKDDLNNHVNPTVVITAQPTQGNTPTLSATTGGIVVIPNTADSNNVTYTFSYKITTATGESNTVTSMFTLNEAAPCATIVLANDTFGTSIDRTGAEAARTLNIFADNGSGADDLGGRSQTQVMTTITTNITPALTVSSTGGTENQLIVDPLTYVGLYNTVQYDVNDLIGASCPLTGSPATVTFHVTDSGLGAISLPSNIPISIIQPIASASIVEFLNESGVNLNSRDKDNEVTVSAFSITMGDPSPGTITQNGNDIEVSTGIPVGVYEVTYSLDDKNTNPSTTVSGGPYTVTLTVTSNAISTSNDALGTLNRSSLAVSYDFLNNDALGGRDRTQGGGEISISFTEANSTREGVAFDVAPIANLINNFTLNANNDLVINASTPCGSYSIEYVIDDLIGSEANMTGTITFYLEDLGLSAIVLDDVALGPYDTPVPENDIVFLTAGTNNLNGRSKTEDLTVSIQNLQVGLTATLDSNNDLDVSAISTAGTYTLEYVVVDLARVAKPSETNTITLQFFDSTVSAPAYDFGQITIGNLPFNLDVLAQATLGGRAASDVTVTNVVVTGMPFTMTVVGPGTTNLVQIPGSATIAAYTFTYDISYTNESGSQTANSATMDFEIVNNPCVAITVNPNTFAISIDRSQVLDVNRTLDVLANDNLMGLTSSQVLVDITTNISTVFTSHPTNEVLSVLNPGTDNRLVVDATTYVGLYNTAQYDVKDNVGDMCSYSGSPATITFHVEDTSLGAVTIPADIPITAFSPSGTNSTISFLEESGVILGGRDKDKEVCIVLVGVVPTPAAGSITLVGNDLEIADGTSTGTFTITYDFQDKNTNPVTTLSSRTVTLTLEDTGPISLTNDALGDLDRTSLLASYDFLDNDSLGGRNRTQAGGEIGVSLLDNVSGNLTLNANNDLVINAAIPVGSYSIGYEVDDLIGAEVNMTGTITFYIEDSSFAANVVNDVTLGPYNTASLPLSAIDFLVVGGNDLGGRTRGTEVTVSLTTPPTGFSLDGNLDLDISGAVTPGTYEITYVVTDLTVNPNVVDTHVLTIKIFDETVTIPSFSFGQIPLTNLPADLDVLSQTIGSPVVLGGRVASDVTVTNVVVTVNSVPGITLTVSNPGVENTIGIPTTNASVFTYQFTYDISYTNEAGAQTANSPTMTFQLTSTASAGGVFEGTGPLGTDTSFDVIDNTGVNTNLINREEPLPIEEVENIVLASYPGENSAAIRESLSGVLSTFISKGNQVSLGVTGNDLTLTVPSTGVSITFRI